MPANRQNHRRATRGRRGGRRATANCALNGAPTPSACSARAGARDALNALRSTPSRFAAEVPRRKPSKMPASRAHVDDRRRASCDERRERAEQSAELLLLCATRRRESLDFGSRSARPGRAARSIRGRGPRALTEARGARSGSDSAIIREPLGFRNALGPRSPEAPVSSRPSPRALHQAGTRASSTRCATISSLRAVVSWRARAPAPSGTEKSISDW